MMHFDDALGDPQTETGATALLKLISIELCKLPEDFAVIFKRNTRARVLHIHL